MDHQGSPRKAKLLTVHLPSLVPTQSIQRCSLRLTDSLMIRQHGVTDEGQQGAFRERAGETGAGVLPMPRGQNGRDHTHTHTHKGGGMCAWSVMSGSLQPYGLYPTRLLCPWNFPCKKYWSVLPFPSSGDLEGSNPRLLCLLHCRQILFHLSRQGHYKGD